MTYEELLANQGALEQSLREKVENFKAVFIIEPEYFKSFPELFTDFKINAIITVRYGLVFNQEIAMISETNEILPVKYCMLIREGRYYSPLVHGLVQKWLNTMESRTRQVRRCTAFKNELLRQTLKV